MKPGGVPEASISQDILTLSLILFLGDDALVVGLLEVDKFLARGVPGFDAGSGTSAADAAESN